MLRRQRVEMALRASLARFALRETSIHHAIGRTTVLSNANKSASCPEVSTRLLALSPCDRFPVGHALPGLDLMLSVPPERSCVGVEPRHGKARDTLFRLLVIESAVNFEADENSPQVFLVPS